MFKKNIMMDTINHEPYTINETMNQTMNKIVNKTMNKTMDGTMNHNPGLDPIDRPV